MEELDKQKQFRRCLFCNLILINRNENVVGCNDKCMKKFKQGLTKEAIAKAVAFARTLPIMRSKLRTVDKRRLRSGSKSQLKAGRFCKLDECNQFFVPVNPNQFYHDYQCQIRANWLRKKERKAYG